VVQSIWGLFTSFPSVGYTDDGVKMLFVETISFHPSRNIYSEAD
jgi:hypothetical protein